MHHATHEHKKFELSLQEQFRDSRKKVLEATQKQRQFLFSQPKYQVTRKRMIEECSKILVNTIEIFMARIKPEKSNRRYEEVRECSLLFNERNYGHRKWHVNVPTSGLASSMPFFAFGTRETDVELDQAPSVHEVEKFIFKNMGAMRLSNEVCLMSLIFVERLLKVGKCQLLTINWRPIVYSALLLAAKYWEDIYFWNVDFVDACRLYGLKETNQLESTFLALCNYELFVPESLYDKYYKIVCGAV